MPAVLRFASIATACLGLALLLAASPQEPRPSSDLAAVDRLESEANDLIRAGKYGEARGKLAEALAILERPPSAKPWRLGDIRRSIQSAERLEAMAPGDREAAWALEAEEAEARQLSVSRRHEEAVKKYRAALEASSHLWGQRDVKSAAIRMRLAMAEENAGLVDQAFASYREALDAALTSAGEDHPLTQAICMNWGTDLAQHALRKQSQTAFEEAASILSRASAIAARVHGPRDPELAKCRNEEGTCALNSGRFDDASRFHAEAARILRDSGQAGTQEGARADAGLGLTLFIRGRYAEADALLRSALVACRAMLGDSASITIHVEGYLALNLDAQGRHAEAEPLHRASCRATSRLSGPKSSDAAGPIDNLALNLDYQNRPAEAEPLHREALEVYRATYGERSRDVAKAYNNLALCLAKLRRYDEALVAGRRSLEIKEAVLPPGHREIARACGNIAIHLNESGRFAEAEPMMRRALGLWDAIAGEESPEKTNALTALANTVEALGRDEEAEAIWARASASFARSRRPIGPSGLDRVEFDSEHSPIGSLVVARARRGDAVGAWTALESSLASGLLDELDRVLDPASRRREAELMAQLQKLDERLRADPGIRPRRDEAVAELARVRIGRGGGTPDDAPVRVPELAKVQASLPPDVALVAWCDRTKAYGSQRFEGEHWACVVRAAGPPGWVRLPGFGPDGRWTEADSTLPAEVARRLGDRPTGLASGSGWEDATASLAAQRIAPIEPLLAARPGLPEATRLIVLTSPAMAGVPIEPLLAARGGTSQRLTVSYAPSATTLTRLWSVARPPPKARRLLALGDPTFLPPPAPTGPAPVPPDHGAMVASVARGSAAEASGLHARDVVVVLAGERVLDAADLSRRLDILARGRDPVRAITWRDGREVEVTIGPGPWGIRLDRSRAADAVAASREAEDALARSRGGPVLPLPGTRREVEAIARLFDRPEVLLGPDASESKLDALASRGQLNDFDVIHLATHGQANSTSPMRSALLLAQEGEGDRVSEVLAGREVYDGELTAEQIVRTWQLDAELVTLSACGSGLGRASGGEGFLGLTQALLLRGARSLVVSLWKADDRATSLLMTRFYENLAGRRPGLNAPMGKAEALREAKGWLRQLPAEAASAELAALDRGTVRPLGPIAPTPAPKATGEAGPFAHPYYWAAFVLIGDPR